MEGDRRVALELAALVESEAEVVDLGAPRQGLVMCEARETARNTRFYLGEALMSECRVRIGDAEGLGLVLGRDDELARALAVIDAAYSLGDAPSCLGSVDAAIGAASRELDARRRREEALTMTSRVSFDEMGGQDMSVQAVVR